MRRTLSLHPASLALGLAFGLVCFLTMGQASTITPSTLGSTVRIEYMPHPRDIVQIPEGTAYTVPAGKLLTLTALGSTMLPGNAVRLRINGQDEASAIISGTYSGVPSYSSIVPVPSGLTAAPGSVLEVLGGWSSDPSDARAWGYLTAQ